MAVKRKAVGSIRMSLKRAKRQAAEAAAEDGEEAPEVAPKVLKRPSAAAAEPPAEAADADAPMEDAAEEQDEGEEQEEEEEASPEQKLKEFEEQERARRLKELKSKAVGEIKELIASHGLDTGNKADMVEALLDHEAKERQAVRDREAKLRAVVVRKKEELEALSVSELAKLCSAAGIKGGTVQKQQRVEALLKQWQENDGVDKALLEVAQRERLDELQAMGGAELRKLCEAAGVDPFIAEVIADRISKRELELGLYRKPVLQAEQGAGAEAEGGDMVTALLVNEKKRKEQKEQQAKKDEAFAAKKKEFKAMNVEELKAALGKHGVEAAGKKDDMVEALLAAHTQEEKVAARRSDLKALSVQELKDLVSGKGLETGSKNDMVERLLQHEAKLRDELRAFEARTEEVLATKKEELEGKTGNELKDLCVSRGLKLGTAKEERVERLLEDFRQGGAEAAVAATLRKARRAALGAMEKDELVQLCDKLGVDPLMKEVMVERLHAHECEQGLIRAA